MAERTWGLNAIGRSGEVDLDLDALLGDGPQTYMLTISLPVVDVRFEIAGPDVTQAFSAFMRGHYGGKVFAELQLGVLERSPVLISKDNEFPDRFFISAAAGRVHVTVVDPVTSDLVRAAEPLAADRLDGSSKFRRGSTDGWPLNADPSCVAGYSCET